jgi:hypothetical protein
VLTAWEITSMQETVVGSFDATAVRQRWSTTTDEYGDQVRSTASDLALPCRLFQTTGSEVTQDRDTQVSDWSLHVPYDADVTGHDTVIVYPVLFADYDSAARPSPTGTFEVIGPPLVRATHKRANLEFVA